jgi:hypothetical protein
MSSNLEEYWRPTDTVPAADIFGHCTFLERNCDLSIRCETIKLAFTTGC